MEKQNLLIYPDQFEKFWTIMETSFPRNERKTKEEYLQQLNEELFEIELYRDDSKVIDGFITWWQLKNYRFVEHFAVSSKYRNQGLGHTLFSNFMNCGNDPVALEVELPVNEITKRRITFYEHLGLYLNPYLYFQPSYIVDSENVEMFLMTSNSKLSEDDFEILKMEIYKTVYQYHI
jgi:ribosomal protein S18 acetylase RimI-like enzyme